MILCEVCARLVTCGLGGVSGTSRYDNFCDLVKTRAIASTGNMTRLLVDFSCYPWEALSIDTHKGLPSCATERFQLPVGTRRS